MIDKSLIIIICFYTVSISVLAGQFLIADVFDMRLTNYKGEPIDSALYTLIRFDSLNQIADNVIHTNFQGNVTEGIPFNRIIDFNVAMAYSVWELVTLLSGTYIFYMLLLFGVPEVIILALVVPYMFLLIRTIIGILRGF